MTIRKHKKFFIIVGCILLWLLLIAAIAFKLLWLDNLAVHVASYNIYSPKIESSFDDYTIAVITDFHNSSNYAAVIDQTARQKPDVIFIIGDLISWDDRNYVGSNADKLLDGLTAVAPVYYTEGNHEMWSKDRPAFMQYLQTKPIHILDNAYTKLEIGSTSINLLGFRDMDSADANVDLSALDQRLDNLYQKIPESERDKFTILMFHRGNYFDLIAQHPFDLVLSGHMHGGQINLPFIREQIVRDHMGSDKYIQGYYRNGLHQMVISGGLEFGVRNIRLFNPPEIAVVRLQVM